MIRSRLSRHQLLTVLFCTISLGGCANSLPFFSEMMPDSAPMITGSIFAPAATLSTELNSADWEKANQALGTALRPENIREPVQWENKTTAARGNFRPIGIAFLQEGDLCKAQPAAAARANGKSRKLSNWSNKAKNLTPPRLRLSHVILTSFRYPVIGIPDPSQNCQDVLECATRIPCSACQNPRAKRM